MAYIDVPNWSAEHVVHYVRGIHKSLEKLNTVEFVKRKVDGSRFLLLTALDLDDLIPNLKVDALYKIIRGIQLLRYFYYQSNMETLQSLTLALASQARNLHNQLCLAEKSPRLLPVSEMMAKTMTTSTTTTAAAAAGTTTITTTTNSPLGQNTTLINNNNDNISHNTNKNMNNISNRFDFVKVNSNMQLNQSTKQRVSLETLQYVSNIVDYIMRIVSWLNTIKASPEGLKFNKDFKSILLRVAVELSSTAQRDQFVHEPNDFIKKTSKFFAEYCEWVVLAIMDTDFIQPCRLDVVSVKRKAEELDFGLVLESGCIDCCQIVDVIFSSPAHRSGRISKGDEIVQVDYQTVIGWPVENIEQLIGRQTNEIILTIKKKPSQSKLNSSILVLKAFAIPKRKIPLSVQSSANSTNALVQSISTENPQLANNATQSINSLNEMLTATSSMQQTSDISSSTTTTTLIDQQAIDKIQRDYIAQSKINHCDTNEPESGETFSVSGATTDKSASISVDKQMSRDTEIDVEDEINIKPDVKLIASKSIISNSNNNNNNKTIESSHNANIANSIAISIANVNPLDQTSENLASELDRLEVSGSTSELDLDLDLPKEPKGPVYELELPKERRDLKRRVSISGSIPDTLVDLSIGDVLPALANNVKSSTSTSSTSREQSTTKDNKEINNDNKNDEINDCDDIIASGSMSMDMNKTNAIKGSNNISSLLTRNSNERSSFRAAKEPLTKSVSHETAKMYLHTLSIDRKHLWTSQSSRDKDTAN